MIEIEHSFYGISNRIKGRWTTAYVSLTEIAVAKLIEGISRIFSTYIEIRQKEEYANQSLVLVQFVPVCTRATKYHSVCGKNNFCAEVSLIVCLSHVPTNSRSEANYSKNKNLLLATRPRSTLAQKSRQEQRVNFSDWFMCCWTCFLHRLVSWKHT